MTPKGKKHPDFPDYIVTNCGKVYNLKLGRYISIDTSNKYCRVTLNNGKRKRFFVHRLVALLYIDNPDSLPIINHKNGDKLDNRVVNLEWSTYGSNLQHAYDTKLRSNRVGESMHTSYLKEKDIEKIFKMRYNSKYSHQKIADIIGTTRANVTAILHRKSWGHVNVEYIIKDDI